MYGENLCNKHYIQLKRKGKILDNKPSHKNKDKICEFCGTIDNVEYYRKTGQLLCIRHKHQLDRFGKILEITVFDRNKYEIKTDEHGDYVEICLRNVKGIEVARTLIDLEDLDRTILHKWGNSNWGYAVNSSTSDFYMLQNFILDKKGLIDHIDRNTLNNRKYNLMFSNKSLNAINCGLRKNNKSGVTGVLYTEDIDKWRSYINWEGKRIELGYYDNKDEAIKTRLYKELELLGDTLAPQKHLFKEYGIMNEICV